MIAVLGNLHLDAPGGGTLRVSADSTSTLTLTFSNGTALREALRAMRAASPRYTSPLRLARLRNPLKQDVDVMLGERRLVHWAKGKRVRLTSLRAILGFLRG